MSHVYADVNTYSPKVTITLDDASLWESGAPQVCTASSSVTVENGPLAVKLFENADGSAVNADVYNPGGETLTYAWTVTDTTMNTPVDVGNQSGFGLTPTDSYSFAVTVTRKDGATASDSGDVSYSPGGGDGGGPGGYSSGGGGYVGLPVDNSDQSTTGGNGDQPTLTIEAGGDVEEGQAGYFDLDVSGSSDTMAQVSYDAAATDESPDISGTFWIAPSWYEGGSSGDSIEVPTIDDVWDGSTTPGQVTMTLSGAENVTPENNSDSFAVDQIQPAVSVEDASPVSEGQWASFPVTLSVPVDYAVKVPYTFSNGSAQVGVDYDGASGTLWIPAGATSGNILVRTMQNLKIAGNSDFSVNLDTPPAPRSTRARPWARSPMTGRR